MPFAQCHYLNDIAKLRVLFAWVESEPVRFLFPAEQEAHGGADSAADDVGHLGDVVLDEQALVDLLAEIHNRDQDESHGDRMVFPDGDGGDQDKGEDDAAGTQQADVREENHVNDARDSRRNRDDDHGVRRAVFLLNHGTEDQDIHHVAEQVIPAGVAQHMGDAADIGQRVGQGCAVHAENGAVGGATGQQVDQEGRGAQGHKGQRRRGVEGKPEVFFTAVHGGSFPVSGR